MDGQRKSDYSKAMGVTHASASNRAQHACLVTLPEPNLGIEPSERSVQRTAVPRTSGTVLRVGFEPTASDVLSVRGLPLPTRAKYSWRDSNPQHLDSKSSASAKLDYRSISPEGPEPDLGIEPSELPVRRDVVPSTSGRE